MLYYDKDSKELMQSELDKLFNPFNGIEFIYRHGLLFFDLAHVRAFEEATPGKLREDIEWAPTVYMLTSDAELRNKAAHHVNADKRKINWDSILATDFGSGHYAAIYWAYGLWGGCSWGGWEDNEGKKIPKVDTISYAFSMDSKLSFAALVAQAFRWNLKGKIPDLIKVFNK